mgnify:CR=1 FL=1|jgi:hypothetical protein
MLKFKELIKPSESFDVYKKECWIDETQYVIAIKRGYILQFEVWWKKYDSKKKYHGESWDFTWFRDVCIMKHEVFKEDLETGMCNIEFNYYAEVAQEAFFKVFEEFLELFNQVEDGSTDILKVLDFIKTYFID